MVNKKKNKKKSMKPLFPKDINGFFTKNVNLHRIYSILPYILLVGISTGHFEDGKRFAQRSSSNNDK